MRILFELMFLSIVIGMVVVFFRAIYVSLNRDKKAKEPKKEEAQ